MASKYQLITDLYESTILAVTNTPGAWTAFLRSACRNYKCRFDEQILIYAQRPDATAVLEIEKWNEQFGRWVNRGATGISVFDDEHNGNYRLKHYFDISDTHESRFARRVPLWQMEPRFEAEVIESLENSFGELEDKATLANALISAARNAVDDNLSDYLNELMYCREDSFLEELDDLNVEVEYRTALQNSVAYMLLTRCSIDAEDYLEPQDFRYAADFNTRSTVNALGLATSDIAELCLLEIAATVRNLRIQERDVNRTFAILETPAYPIPIKQNDERSADNGTDLSDGGRLPRTESDRAGGIPRNPWQIRIAPQEVSEAAPPRSVPESPDGGDT
ncbi:MAG: DNA methylase, partial [Bacillota bacterium]